MKLGIQVPIIPGIMPIQSYASFLRVTKLCGIRISPDLLTTIAQIKVEHNSFWHDQSEFRSPLARSMTIKK